jgi:galactoside O-acetyltransferase
MSTFYSREELLRIGFAAVGDDVHISRLASIHNPENMMIGSHVRIDDFCFLSGRITLRNYIHIPTASLFYGGPEGIVMDDFSAVSQRCTLIADSDDYSGQSLTNPTTSERFKSPITAPIHIKRHVIVGACSTVMPGVTIEEGCAIGAMSLVLRSTRPWTINVGAPCRELKERSKRLLELEKRFLSEERDAEALQQI